MTAYLTNRALDEITMLLDRLDPASDGICAVPGCVHHHVDHEPFMALVGAGAV